MSRPTLFSIHYYYFSNMFGAYKYISQIRLRKLSVIIPPNKMVVPWKNITLELIKDQSR